MKKTLLKTKLFKATLVVIGLLFSGTIFGQTTIANGQTVDAGDIAANTAIIIQSGGTLNMDASRTFTTITTTGSGISTISGAAQASVNTLSVGANNTLSVAAVVQATTLVTPNLNNQTATLAGTGNITTGTIVINADNFVGATLSISSPLTVQSGNINAGNGSGSTHNMITNGHLKISGTLNGIDGFTCNTGSTIEYNGGAQAVLNHAYYNLTLSGTGAKTFSADRTITGNFLLENGASLTLGGNDLTIDVNGNRTATINGTLNINGNGRLNESGNSTKTLVVGSTGYVAITDAGGTDLGDIDLNAISLNATSTVEYGASDDQQITDVAAPGYGHLIISGGNTKSASGNLDIQGNLTISSATFNAGNSTHSLKGNWVKNGGTFTTGTGRISFTGAAAQTIGGSQPTTFYNVTFANTNGGITLTQPATISTNAGVTFTSGVVNTDATNLLIFNDEATSSLLVTNPATTSYVNGPVRKVGNKAFVFPIGGATGFVPLSISAPDNNADAFTARYVRGVPIENTDITVAGVDHISYCDYWDLTETNDAGTANTINATFYWNANNPCNGAGNYIDDPAKIKAVHYTGGAWSAASVGVGAGSNVAGSVIFAGLTTFSPFALGSTTSTENPLPVVFADVKAYEKNNGVQVEWSNLTEKDVAEYTIERSGNGRDFSAIGKQLPTSNQDHKASYIAFDAIPNAGANYYRIKAQETTGKIVYSKVLSVSLGKANSGLRLYPNPVSGNQVTVSLSNVKQGKYNLRVVNTAGQDIFKQVINNQSNSLTQTLDLPSSVKPGVYNMIITGDNYRETKTFIVQ